MGLLKRGLGAISILGGETTLSSSLKGDQFHGEAKVTKFAAYSVSSVSAHHKIGKLALFFFSIAMMDILKQIFLQGIFLFNF